jgi:hypothetical protein
MPRSLFLIVLVCLAGVPAVGALRAEPLRNGATAERELVVVNHSQQGINELYVSAATAEQWGEDRLADSTLDIGKSVHLRLGRSRDCVFDLQVVYEDASREEVHGFDVCHSRQLALDGSGAVRARNDDDTPHQIVLLNQAGRPIQQVMISPSEAGDWGDDLLAHSSISVGDRANVTYRGECVADLRVVFDNRSAEERHGVDVCTIDRIVIQPGWTTADSVAAPDGGAADPLPLTVTNSSGYDVDQLYVFPDGAPDRGPDLLAGAALANGAQSSVALERRGACTFSVHAVATDKRPQPDLVGLDLCQRTQITLPPGTLATSHSP